MGLIYLELCTVYRWLNGLTHNEAQHRGLLPAMLPPQQTSVFEAWHRGLKPAELAGGLKPAPLPPKQVKITVNYKQ